MISAIGLSNFMGVKSCKIDGFKQINVLVGSFNSGKSTVLDALCLARMATRMVTGIQETFPAVLQRRTGRQADARDLFYTYDVEQRVSINLSLYGVKQFQGEASSLAVSQGSELVS